MKNTIITELVKIEQLQSVSDEQLMAKTGIINDYLRKQDGFIDCELVKAVEGNTWYFVYHIENMQKLQVVGEKIRSSKLFDSLNPLMVPGSMNVSFFYHLKRW